MVVNGVLENSKHSMASQERAMGGGYCPESAIPKEIERLG